MKYVGIDIGKRRHCAGGIDPQGQVVLKPKTVEQTEEGLEAFAERLHALGTVEEVRIGIEASGHYWMILYHFLTERGWSVDVMNPIISAASARTNIRGRKTDADDSLVIARALRDGGFVPLRLGDDYSEQLKTLCRQRRFVVSELANAKRRLTGLVDRVFPEFSAQFSDPYGRAALAVLTQYPSARLLADAHLKSLTGLLSKASRGRLGRKKAQELRMTARHSVARRIHDEALEYAIQVMRRQLDFFQEQIDALDEKIEDLFRQTSSNIKTIDGIGDVVAPIISAELGDLDRFKGKKAVKHILAYAGLDPRIRESGQWKGKVKMSKRGSPTLRTALIQAASMARLCCQPFDDIYQKHKAKGKHHFVAISHVARKLVEVIWALHTSGGTFDAQKLSTATP